MILQVFKNKEGKIYIRTKVTDISLWTDWKLLSKKKCKALSNIINL